MSRTYQETDEQRTDIMKDPTAMKHNALARYGGLSAIVAVGIALFGLITFFSGAGSGDNSTIHKALQNGSDFSQAQTGAVWLIVGMSLLIAFSVWLAHRYGPNSVLVSIGAVTFSLGALMHIVENLFVIGSYGTSLPAIRAGAPADMGTAAALHISNTASYIAFGFLGAGVLAAALGFWLETRAPAWMTMWGVIAGIAGIVSAFIDFPAAQPLMLGWLVAVGVRAAVQPAA